MTQLQRITITPDQLRDSGLLLTAEQQHYLRRVLRLGDGDRFIATGLDSPWLAALTATGLAPLLEPLPPPPPLPVQIHLIAALPKTGFDEVVRQSTELGVGSIRPVLSDRTLLNPSPNKLRRWQRIATEAAEQCERGEVPLIHPPASLDQALAAVPAERLYFCTARGGSPSLLSRLELDGLRQDAEAKSVDAGETIPSLALAVGPEGGWSKAEIQRAMAQGCLPVSLGPTILRAVTAPLAAIAQIMARYDRV